MTFTVTVSVKGKPNFRCTVEARDAWHARTRAMISYPYQLRGETVEYSIRKG
jgi:hypothetical protein